jgi:hypothetical protein
MFEWQLVIIICQLLAAPCDTFKVNPPATIEICVNEVGKVYSEAKAFADAIGAEGFEIMCAAKFTPTP